MSFLRTASSAAPVVTPQFTGLQIQTSSSALPIPIVYGVTRVAPNIIWARNFRSYPQYSQPSGGKGGSGSSGPQITGYTYTTSIMMGLCEGPIAGLGVAFDGQSIYAASDTVNLLTGTTPQAPWGYLSAKFPQQALGYGGTAIAYAGAYDLGSSASLGSLSFEVVGLLAGSAGGGSDAAPAQVVYDFLVNAQYGVGFPAASIDGNALYGAYQPYCQSYGLAFSPVLSDQETANATLTRWLALTNATAVWSAGMLKILPYADAAAAVYDLTDDDLVGDGGADPIVVTRSDPYGAANVVLVEALDRGNSYSPTTVQARDQGSIEQTGLRQGSTITAHEFCDPTAAGTAAQLILQRGLYTRNTYAFKLSWEHCLLEPMDVVTLTDSGIDLARTPVRIAEIAEDADGLLSVTAEEFLGGLTGVTYPTAGSAASAISYTPPAPAATYVPPPVDSATSVPVNRSVAPAPVNPPLILEPPSDLTDGAPQLWVGLSGGTAGQDGTRSADPNWGGAAIFASTDNATYVQVGTTTGAARQGILTAALGAPPGGAPDTLTVDFAQSGATIVATGQPTLLVVDGEIMSFASATLTAGSTYSLGTLKRRLYGGRGGAHAAGAQALILDKAVFTYTLASATIGRPLWLKFASVNVFGRAMQDLATCIAYPVMPVGSGVFGPIAQAIATGTSLDAGYASTTVNESGDYGVASDPYTEGVDMGLASEAATALALQSGGTGATAPAMARQNIGAAASGANSDITSLANLAGLGIGTSVDTTTNKLSVKAASSLFDNIGGGVQQTINKAGLSDTAALFYQTGYSTRAQAGLLGSDRYRVSVSFNGTGFKQAVDIEPATGNVGLAGFTADANNALGVLGTACLFAAATDSMRFTFNKVAATNDAALSFQTGFSARALAGLLGSDGYQLKVSPNGATFYQVYVCDQTSGNIAFKALLGAAPYAVASLPLGFDGAVAVTTNGRKIGEAAGAGTGVPVYFSSGKWRRFSDDSVVVA